MSRGRVAGAAGLSLVSGPHCLILDRADFRTWCAYDSLGIAAALEADAEIHTTCGECGVPIALTLRAGVPDRTGPERLWLATGGQDLRGSFCMPTVLLCGDTHLDAGSTVRPLGSTASRIGPGSRPHSVVDDEVGV